jgi:Icc-related predicted phosphoesterase
MRIAFVVDVHDRFDEVPRALEAIGPVDVLVVGGDLTNAGTPEDAERAIGLWRPLAPRLLAVAGNMDSPAIDDRLVALGVSIDGRGVIVDGVGLFGASASPPTPFRTPHEVPDETLADSAQAGLDDVASAPLKIFVPHSPPYGTVCDLLRSGEHVGSRSLRTFIEREQPDLVLCGHVHEARGEDRLERSRIVNPGPALAGHYAVVEVGEAVAVSLS